MYSMKFLYIKNTAELFEINDFIDNNEITNIKNIIDKDINLMMALLI